MWVDLGMTPGRATTGVLEAETGRDISVEASELRARVKAKALTIAPMYLRMHGGWNQRRSGFRGIQNTFSKISKQHSIF